MGRKEQERCQHYREQLVKDRERLADFECDGCPEPVQQTTLFSAEPVQASMFDSHLEAAYEDAQSGTGEWE
jgi:hypothetical protein